jgi:hypothetical protein
MRLFFLIFINLFFNKLIFSQTTPPTPGGGWARIEIENGDTLYVATLRTVSIRGQRIFKSKDDQHQYVYYKRCAQKVYPFAAEAVKLYNEMKAETADMNRRERKKHAKANQKDLEGEYEEQLKKLTKNQGKVLIKMIERYTGEDFYTIIKETRGGGTAFYWNGLGKVWGYDLKDGYEVGKEPILDAVLEDFDLSMSVD